MVTVHMNMRVSSFLHICAQMVRSLESDMVEKQTEVIPRTYVYWTPYNWDHMHDFICQELCKTVCSVLRKDARGNESIFKMVVAVCKAGFEHLSSSQAIKEHQFDGLGSLCDQTTVGQEATARTVVGGTCVAYSKFTYRVDTRLVKMNCFPY